MRKSQSVFWALVALAATGLTARADQLQGVVQSIDAESRKMVVKATGNDRLIDVTVPAGASIATARGTTMLLKDLRKGDGVGISHLNGVASLVHVSQAPLQGIVSSTDTDTMKLVLTPTGSDRDVEVATTSRTAFENSGGKVLKLKDLKPGDGISVNYDGPEVSKVVVNEKLPELLGHVKSVAADLKSIVVTELGTNTDTTVVINNETTIVTNEGKPLEVKALKKGDGVGISHVKGLASKIRVNVGQP